MGKPRRVFWTCFLFELIRIASPQVPAYPYEWSIRHFSNVPDWQVPNLYEVKVHRRDENYQPTCTTDSPFVNSTCLKKNKNPKIPDSPYKSCRIVISEINSDTPSNNQKGIFVELEEVCFDPVFKYAKTLKGFKLAVVEGTSSSLVMVIDLRTVEIPDKKEGGNRYIVIGTDDVPNVNVKFNDAIVQSVYNNPGSSITFPVGDNSPYGVVLLYSSSLLALRDVQLAVMPGVGLFEKRLIDESLMAKMRELIQDMVVYGRKVYTNRCDVFERLWYDDRILIPSFNYLLRDWDRKNTVENPNEQDLSLGRCSDLADPFLPSKFKLGKPSPSESNDCTGARFILEEHIYEVTQRLQPNLEPVDLPEACQSDIINMPNEKYKRVNEDLYHGARDAAMVQAKRQCLENPGPTGEYAEADTNADMDIERIDQCQGVPFVPPYDQRNFRTEWIEKGNKFLPKGSTVLEDPVFQAWLRLRSTDTGETRFYCDVCSTLIKSHFHVERNKVKDIMKEKGFIRTSPAENEQEIAEHLKSPLHADAEGYLREIYAQEAKELVYTLLEQQESFASKLLTPTVRMVRSVYMETSSGISYRKHENIVNLQKANGVNLGIHAYHKSAAKDISDIISTNFHETLLTSLIQNDMDFTLLVDATTDSRNIPYLVVFIQTLERNRPTIYFYRLIELVNGESALATMTSLWNKVEEDSTPDRNLTTYFIRRMIAFSSDGASVMIAKRTSLHVMLQQKIGRQIPAIICMAHKLQNAVKRGIKKGTDPDLRYFDDFETSINQFYNFYSSRGSKRWQHFEATARELGIEYARIKYFFEVRWSSSQYSALYNLVKDYVPLHADTESITESGDFTKAAKETAEKLHNILRDKSWSIVLHHMTDILNIFKDISEDLQTQAGTLPGKYGIIQRGVDSINDLRGTYGAFVKSFLSKCSCRSNPCKSICTMNEYENCQDLIYTTASGRQETVLELENTLPKSISIAEKNDALLDSLINGIKFYFNMDDLKHFELFNQKVYVTPDCDLPQNSIFWTPSMNEVIPMDANDHIQYLGTFYGMTAADISEIKNNWDAFYRQLITNPSYVRNLKSDFEYFWTLVLKNEREELTNFPVSLRSLIQKMLVTPFSTAECERAFSILTSTMSTRNQLSSEALENVMRVAINGNSDYFQFRVIPATQTYLKTHARVDDDSFKGGRPPKPIPWSKLLPKSALF